MKSIVATEVIIKLYRIHSRAIPAQIRTSLLSTVDALSVGVAELEG